ncbi:hypothetical protein T12_6102 [Trichinella patagoniensis]|uniref:Uncharacterized protein n=1 Tax=Trichinella patagoniensis TaxID=990121 RepID=A0A0V0ZXK6_9BILA|nr:hypothetical protein T12_6102 [Trichinella patagoniensis]
MRAFQKWMDCLAHLLLSKKHCAYSSFMHYVFTQILRYFHAVLDCGSMKADVLHFHTYLGQLPSFWNRLTGAASPNLVKSLSQQLWCGASYAETTLH